MSRSFGILISLVACFSNNQHWHRVKFDGISFVYGHLWCSLGKGFQNNLLLPRSNLLPYKNGKQKRSRLYFIILTDLSHFPIPSQTALMPIVVISCFGGGLYSVSSKLSSSTLLKHDAMATNPESPGLIKFRSKLAIC